MRSFDSGPTRWTRSATRPPRWARGFAIGSAALTALALFSTFRTKADDAIELAGGPGGFDERLLSLSLDNPNVLIGMLLGGMLPFIFAALTMNAVGRSAAKMIEEVRRQFREIKGLLEGEAEPDSARCVAISTQSAIREMIIPGVLAVLAPVLTGFLLGRLRSRWIAGRCARDRRADGPHDGQCRWRVG